MFQRMQSWGLVVDPCLPLSHRKVVQIARVALDVVAGPQVIQSLDHGIHTDEEAAHLRPESRMWTPSGG